MNEATLPEVDDLIILRRKVNRGLVLLLWAQVPLIFAAAALCQNRLAAACLAGTGIAGAGTLAWWLAPDSKATRVTIGLGLIGLVSIILAVCRGSIIQPDVHMYYFVMLAILSAYCDRLVLLTAAAAVIIDHLILNVAAPALLYTGGGDLPRALMHGALVALEAGTLLWMTGQVVLPFKAAARHLQALAAATEATQRAEAEAARTQLALLEAERQREAEAMRLAQAAVQQEVVASLAGALSKLAEGDLIFRLTTPFAPAYERLRVDFNAAVAQLLESMKLLVDSSATIRRSARDISDAVAELTWRNSMQRQALLQAMRALSEMTEGSGKTGIALSRARIIINAADADIRSCLAEIASPQAALAQQRVDERAVALQQLLNGSAVAADERQAQLTVAGSAMQEMREIMGDYAETITAANQACQALVNEAEALVDRVCEFNISEAAARAAWPADFKFA